MSIMAMFPRSGFSSTEDIRSLAGKNPKEPLLVLSGSVRALACNKRERARTRGRLPCFLCGRAQSPMKNGADSNILGWKTLESAKNPEKTWESGDFRDFIAPVDSAQAFARGT